VSADGDTRSPPDPPHTEHPREDMSVGEMVFDVSERVSILVREEIELAKAEVTEKVQVLLRGGAVGIAAGVFALMGLAMLMHGFAWLINELFFEDDVWVGFMIEALFWFIVAAGAGYFAYRSFQKGSPPTPDLAIEEARRVRQTLEGGTTPHEGATPSQSTASHERPS
jgi:Putative Actinobacterial Holin-X, holin superfamily III